MCVFACARACSSKGRNSRHGGREIHKLPAESPFGATANLASAARPAPARGPRRPWSSTEPPATCTQLIFDSAASRG